MKDLKNFPQIINDLNTFLHTITTLNQNIDTNNEVDIELSRSIETNLIKKINMIILLNNISKENFEKNIDMEEFDTWIEDLEFPKKLIKTIFIYDDNSEIIKNH